MKIDEFLDVKREDDGIVFALPETVHGAFGGAFGGMLAACCVYAARTTASQRTPTGIDCRFVRGLPAGTGRAIVTPLHEGRSLSTICVDLFDEREKLCTRASVSLVDKTLLRDLARPSKPPTDSWIAYDDAKPWPAVAPIVATLKARSVGGDDRGFATAIEVPWDVDERSEESACLAADLAVGMPIGATLTEAGEQIPRAPNPDLSLRFCGAIETRRIVGVSRTERMEHGVMALVIAVFSGEQIVAIGQSSAIALGG